MSSRVETVALSVHAMATRFELVLYGDDAVRLRAGGEQALDEIVRVERQLSFYRTDSEIGWVNAKAAHGPVKVDPRLFRLLERCAELWRSTDGAFDVTVGPLVRAWGFADGSRAIPSDDAIAAAKELVGMRKIVLDADALTVRFTSPGVAMDLSGYGKGYAVECAIDALREAGIRSALLHGGTSSVFGLGTPPSLPAWRIGLAEPLAGTVDLVDSGLSVSASHGKRFTADGVEYGHVLDPRSARPVSVAAGAAVFGASAATCEALSTALMVHGLTWLPTLRSRFPGYDAVVG